MLQVFQEVDENAPPPIVDRSEYPNLKPATPRVCRPVLRNIRFEYSAHVPPLDEFATARN